MTISFALRAILVLCVIPSRLVAWTYVKDMHSEDDTSCSVACHFDKTCAGWTFVKHEKGVTNQCYLQSEDFLGIKSEFNIPLVHPSVPYVSGNITQDIVKYNRVVT